MVAPVMITAAQATVVDIQRPLRVLALNLRQLPLRVTQTAKASLLYAAQERLTGVFILFACAGIHATLPPAPPLTPPMPGRLVESSRIVNTSHTRIMTMIVTPATTMPRVSSFMVT